MQRNTCTRFGALLSAVYRLYTFSYGFVAEIFNRRTRAQARAHTPTHPPTHTHTHTHKHTHVYCIPGSIGPKGFNLFLLLLRQLPVHDLLFTSCRHITAPVPQQRCIAVFRIVTSRGLVDTDGCFGGTFIFRFHEVATDPSEVFMPICQSTRRHVTEDCNF